MDDKFIFNSGTRWRSNWDGQRLVWIIAPVMVPLVYFNFIYVVIFSVLGGESAWGPAFKDEFKPNLSHAGLQQILWFLRDFLLLKDVKK